jgi:hypothetical protein
LGEKQVTSAHGAAFPVVEVTGPVDWSSTLPGCHPETALQLGRAPSPKSWQVLVDVRKLAPAASAQDSNAAMHSAFVIKVLAVIVAKTAPPFEFTHCPRFSQICGPGVGVGSLVGIWVGCSVGADVGIELGSIVGD